MGLANVLCEWDYPMYLVNGTILPCEWDYPMCPGKELANVTRMGLSNVPCEWD